MGGPCGIVLACAPSYAACEGWGELAKCPASVRAVHGALVTKCGFDGCFPCRVGDVTTAHIAADMDAAACKADSHDVVLLFFSGHGVQFRGDVHLLDSNGEFVSSRTLRHRFESKVKERGLVDVTLLLFLDCCQERKGT